MWHDHPVTLPSIFNRTGHLLSVKANVTLLYITGNYVVRFKVLGEHVGVEGLPSHNLPRSSLRHQEADNSRVRIRQTLSNFQVAPYPTIIPAFCCKVASEDRPDRHWMDL